MKSLFSLVLLVILLLPQSLLADYSSKAGEIPWPLAKQDIVTQKNTAGVWIIGDGLSQRIFNIEMRELGDGDYIWMRVAELMPDTLNMIAWGEIITSAKDSKVSGKAYGLPDWLEIVEDDGLGTYVIIAPNSVKTMGNPTLLRMVEVQTALGTVLGLSIMQLRGGEQKHFLGTRYSKKPLSCFRSESDTSRLSCYLF